MMVYLSVSCNEDRLYGIICGLEYSDIKMGEVIHYAIEYLVYKKYASLYVPEYSIQRYKKEVVASEILREYGWNNWDRSVVCSKDSRKRVKEELNSIESGIFPIDKNYFIRCRKQFVQSYDGKETPLWEEDKDAISVIVDENPCCVIPLLIIEES